MWKNEKYFVYNSFQNTVEICNKNLMCPSLMQIAIFILQIILNFSSEFGLFKFFRLKK